MCDECSFCYRAGWRAELRLTPENQLTCCDCWDSPDWDELQTLDDAFEAHITAMDDKAHARAERRDGL